MPVFPKWRVTSRLSCGLSSPRRRKQGMASKVICPVIDHSVRGDASRATWFQEIPRRPWKDDRHRPDTKLLSDVATGCWQAVCPFARFLTSCNGPNHDSGKPRNLLEFLSRMTMDQIVSGRHAATWHGKLVEFQRFVLEVQKIEKMQWHIWRLYIDLIMFLYTVIIELNLLEFNLFFNDII